MRAADKCILWILRVSLITLCMIVPSITGILPAWADSDCIGLVTSANGEWTMIDKAGKSKPIKKYSAVVEGARLKPSSASDTIVIQLSDRSTVNRHGYAQENVPITLVEKPDSVWEKALRLLNEQPQTFISTMARGSSTLTDTIVATTDSSADFSPAFVDMEPGSYRFNLRPVTGTSDNAEKSFGPFEVSVSKKGNTSVPLQNVPNGLYELTVVDNKQAVLSKCWTLLANDKTISESQKKWQMALEKTKNWKDKPNTCSRSCFLKAILFSISRSNLENESS